jgi:predicted Na+-dependent transporter
VRIIDRCGERLADHIAPVAAFAVLLALIVPSHPIARRSDVLLAALVLATAALIDPRQLREVRRQAPAIAMLAVGTFLVLTLCAWLISRLFSGDVRAGVLSLGLASTEVASVGLVGLAGGDAVTAVGTLTLSLITSAVLGPLLASVLAHPAGHESPTGLLGRFALVVLAPLVGGLLLRGLRPGLAGASGTLNGSAALLVCALLYAAISGIQGGHQLVDGLLGSAAFIVVSTFVAVAIRGTPLFAGLDRAALLFTTSLRDFAVAAALAAQAFGTRAASVAGEYGALMLLAGAITASVMRRRAARPG